MRSFKLPPIPFTLPSAGGVTLPNKRLLIIAAVAVIGGFVGWWLLMAIAFGQDSVKEQTVAALEKHFGRKVSVGSDISYSSLPVPQLIIANVNVENDPRSRKPSMLTIPQLTATVQPFSLFQSNTMVNLHLQSPKIDLEVFEDGTGSWEIKADSAKDDAALITGIVFEGGELHYANPLRKRVVDIKEIASELQFTSADSLQSTGSMRIGQTAYNFKMDAAGEGAGSYALDMGISDTVSTLYAKGSWSDLSKTFTGEQRFESADIGALLRNFFPARDKQGKKLESLTAAEPEIVEGEPAEGTKKKNKKLPLQMTSKASFSESKLALEDIVIEGDEIKGKGSLQAVLGDVPQISTRLDFDKLALSSLADRGILYDLLTYSESTEIVEGYQVDLPEGKRTALPFGVNMDLVVTGKEFSFLSLPAKNLQFQAKLNDSKVDIAQLSGLLEGDTQFIIKGLVEGSFEGLSLKGQLDVGGNEFYKFAPNILGKKIQIPERLKQFRGRSNIFVTPDSARFSETVLRVEDFQLLGTILRQRFKEADASNPALVALTGADAAQGLTSNSGVNYEGALRIDRINFDELLAAQAQQKKKEKKEAESSKEEAAFTYPEFFEVAKQLQSSIGNSVLDFRVNCFDFVLHGKSRTKANVVFYVNAGGVAINNFDVEYNQSNLTGSVGIAYPEQGLPSFQADIKVDALDTKEFFEHDFAADESVLRDIDGTWSKQALDLSWLRKVEGNISFMAGSLKHENYDANNVVLEANIADSALQISKLEAAIWGGTVNLTSKVLASKLPSFNSKFSLRNIDITQLRSTTTLFGDLMGKLSLTGEAVSTGVNPFSVLQNAQGVISVAGRGLVISGFNLANLVRAANSVRTVDDIDKLIQFADEGGVTNVDSLQGNINLAGGVLRSPGIVIGTQEGGGTINGQLGLLDWNLNSAVTIYLTALQQQDPPLIRLVFAGPVNEAVKTLDTQSLESFIAKQAAERILETR